MKFAYKAAAINKFLPYINKVFNFGMKTILIETSDTKLLLHGSSRKTANQQMKIVYNDFEVLSVFDPLEPEACFDVKKLSSFLRLAMLEIYGEEYKLECLKYFNTKRINEADKTINQNL